MTEPALDAESRLVQELLALVGDPERLRGGLDQDDREAIAKTWRAAYREQATGGAERPEYLELGQAIEDELGRFLAAVRKFAQATGNVPLEQAVERIGGP